jgi:hypothetical protein
MEMFWHDASKELPREDRKRYYVLTESISGGKKYLRHNICYFTRNLYAVDNDDFNHKRGESGWYAYDSEVGYYEWTNVRYWMELPPIPGEDQQNIAPAANDDLKYTKNLLRKNPVIVKELREYLSSLL